jgi:hypothetical protein
VREFQIDSSLVALLRKLRAGALRMIACVPNLTKSHSSGWGLLYFETGGLRCS